MLPFGTTPPDDEKNQWRYQIDRFVEENQSELAALAWGLLQEWGESQDTLGIDLQPKPHFIRCSRSAIEKLNRKVNRQIQEILGVLDGYKPQEEVVAIAIGEGQIKLINFQSDPLPPDCFAQLDTDLDRLIEELENRMLQYFS